MSTTKKAASKKVAATKIKKARRDADGLIEGIDYRFDDEGFIDWRAMVSPDMVYPNREWFLRNDKPVPESTEGLEDHQLLIKLGGLKKLLRLRGYSSVDFTVKNIADGHVVATAVIGFTPNYETDGEHIVYSEVANARDDNTDGFGEKFLETFACNRAFARCIRNALNINIVSNEEMDKSGAKKASTGGADSSAPATSGFSPQDSLQNKANEKGFNTFPKFLQRLRELWEDGVYKNDQVGNWKSFKDVPAKDARTLIGLI